MLLKKKSIVYCGLLAFVLLGVAAVKAPAFQERNLKVLPLDISDQKLDSIMESYNKALGGEMQFLPCEIKSISRHGPGLPFRCRTHERKCKSHDADDH